MASASLPRRLPPNSRPCPHVPGRAASVPRELRDVSEQARRDIAGEPSSSRAPVGPGNANRCVPRGGLSTPGAPLLLCDRARAYLGGHMASMPECALTRCYGLTSSGSSVARAAEHRCQDVPPALPQEREPKGATDPPPRHSRQEPTPTGTELECWAHDEDSAGTADGGCFWASRTVRRAAPGAQRLRTIEDHAPTVTHHAPGLDPRFGRR